MTDARRPERPRRIRRGGALTGLLGAALAACLLAATPPPRPLDDEEAAGEAARATAEEFVRIESFFQEIPEEKTESELHVRTLADADVRAHMGKPTASAAEPLSRAS